jgi:hypothetical protein
LSADQGFVVFLRRVGRYIWNMRVLENLFSDHQQPIVFLVKFFVKKDFNMYAQYRSN